MVSKIDRVRERELFRYYQPRQEQINETCVIPKSASSPDITLTALAQLVAIRLNVRTVLINVIGKDRQYTLSEGTRTLNLDDTSKSDSLEDTLWIGQGSIPKNESLCQNTIKLPGLAESPDHSQAFTIPDLSKDERFSHLAYVAGAPHWRFYVGTPLTTSRGVNIGALCVLDENPRTGLTEDEEKFCATMSRTIMKHLELTREAEEKKKGLRMSEALNAFIERKSWLDEDGRPEAAAGNDSKQSRRREYTKLSKSKAHDIRHVNDVSLPGEVTCRAKNTVNHGDSSRLVNKSARATDGGLSQGLSSGEELDESDSSNPQDHFPDEINQNELEQDLSRALELVFSRAANLLRQALDEDDGGVIFFDTTTGFRNLREIDQVSPITPEFPKHVGHKVSTLSSPIQDLIERHPILEVSSFSLEGTSEMGSNGREAVVLGSSMPNKRLGPDSTTDRIYRPITERMLQKLLKRYPQGQVWSFDEDGSLSNSDEDWSSTQGSQASMNAGERRVNRINKEADYLQYCFPGVRQLLFTPLWDAGQSRWFSGCFCWTREAHHIFSKETELSFQRAFGNSVMAEVSRLATVVADQQKSAFLGSISHEIRSPLHGILASAEFLSETNCDVFQESLIGTINSCGRTLLDTLNQVLDFSKINAFDRNWKRARKDRKNGRSNDSMDPTEKIAAIGRLPGGATPLLNIYAVTNVAAVVEETIESCYAGQTYQNINAPDITDMSAEVQGRKLNKALPATNRRLHDVSSLQLSRAAVSIILDIDVGDYTFTTQPGALRRVVMNILGNALKYTEKGLITIKLKLDDLGQQSTDVDGGNTKILTIKVQDTGKGISSGYLRTRLFTPFAQENALAPGTGLGLSMVHSITNMLGGTIDIHSQVGVGTEVTVALPLRRGNLSETPISTPSSVTSLDHSQDESISTLQNDTSSICVSLYGFTGPNAGDLLAAETERVLRHYISNWYGLDILPAWPPSRIPDIVISDERDIPSLLSSGVEAPKVIALCSSPSRSGLDASQTSSANRMEFLSKPFGPYKLAKSIRACLVKVVRSESEVPEIRASDIVPVNVELQPPIIGLRGVTLEDEDKAIPTILRTNGTISVADTENAHKAIVRSFSNNGDNLKGSEFPFESQETNNDNTGTTNGDGSMEERSKRPKSNNIDTGPTMSDRNNPNMQEIPSLISDTSDLITPTNGPKPSFMPIQEKRSPKVLIVDDNKINLQLLQTFMKKRKCTLVDSAQDGQIAVEAATLQADGYDIIFMDISMPIKNGFEATREIRELESSRQSKNGVPTTVNGYVMAKIPSRAFIIALTGLASSQDQSEAFKSGVDLFMTKPVSFREVGKLLDNWELNGGFAKHDYANS